MVNGTYIPHWEYASKEKESWLLVSDLAEADKDRK